MGFYQVFVYLQLLDLLTTLVGFRMGAAEASPFIRRFPDITHAPGQPLLPRACGPSRAL